MTGSTSSTIVLCIVCLPLFWVVAAVIGRLRGAHDVLRPVAWGTLAWAVISLALVLPTDAPLTGIMIIAVTSAVCVGMGLAARGSGLKVTEARDREQQLVREGRNRELFFRRLVAYVVAVAVVTWMVWRYWQFIG